jgi:nucleoside-diphosphate-sugar epimerase
METMARQKHSGISTTKKEVVVVSGSSGLIGSALIKKLTGKYQLIGLDNAGYPYPPPEAECITIDITSDEDVEKAFEAIHNKYGSQIASFIHLAAYYSFSEKSSTLYDKITVKGTERLLKHLQHFDVEQFLFTSSMLVYKPSEPGVKITEQWPLQPKWGYPKSKVATEEVMHKEHGTIPIMNLRVAGVYTDEGNSIPIANQIQRIYEKQITAYLFPGDPSHGSTFIHLDDLITAMVKAIEKRDEFPSETTLNIGEDETLSYEELQHIISKEIYGKEWKVIRTPKAVAKAGAFIQNLFGNNFIKPWMIDIADDHYELDSSKAKRLLQWQLQHLLGKTLPKMIAVLKEDPLQWYQENKLHAPSWLKKKYPLNAKTK